MYLRACVGVLSQVRLRFCGLQTSRLLCLRVSPGKNTGVDCHFLLQGLFLREGLNSHLLHWQENSLPLYYLGSPASRQSIAIFGTLACRCITLWFLCCKILLVSYSWRWKSLNRVWLFVDPMTCRTLGFRVHHQLQGLAQTHVHRISDAIQPS